MTVDPDRLPAGAVEAAAQAIYAEQDNPIPWDALGSDEWRRDYERNKARAALAAGVEWLLADDEAMERLIKEAARMGRTDLSRAAMGRAALLAAVQEAP